MDTPTPTETDRQSAVPCSALFAIREAALGRRKLLLKLAEENRNDHDQLTARANALGDLYEVLGAGERGMANAKLSDTAP